MIARVTFATVLQGALALVRARVDAARLVRECAELREQLRDARAALGVEVLARQALRRALERAEDAERCERGKVAALTQRLAIVTAERDEALLYRGTWQRPGAS